MLPFIFDWHWTIGRIIFMGLFYAALVAIGSAVGFSFLKTFIDVRNSSDTENH